MSKMLLVCPNCRCFKQGTAYTKDGLPIRNTYECTTCFEIYQNQHGEMVTLLAGDRQKHKEVA